MNLYKNYDDFYNAVINKKIEIIKQLLLQYPYDLTEDDCFIFRIACLKSNLEIVQLLYNASDKKINIRCLNDMAFLNACSSNQFDIIKWLFEINPSIDIHTNNEAGLICACVNNNLELVSFLHEKSNNFKYDNLHLSYELMCKRGMISIPSFLSSKCDDFYIKIEDNNIKDWKIVNKYQRKILDDNNYVSNEIIELCNICYIDNIFYVKYDCNHYYCRNCAYELKKCPMCNKLINTDNIILLKIEI